MNILVAPYVELLPAVSLAELQPSLWSTYLQVR